MKKLLESEKNNIFANIRGIISLNQHLQPLGLGVPGRDQDMDFFKGIELGFYAMCAFPHAFKNVEKQLRAGELNVLRGCYDTLFYFYDTRDPKPTYRTFPMPVEFEESLVRRTLIL